MASADIRVVAPRDWILANPWLWAFLGLVLAGVGFALAAPIWYPDGKSEAPIFSEATRVSLIVLGMLASGGAVTIRFSSRRTAYLAELPAAGRSLLLLVQGVVFGLTCLAVTFGLIDSIFQFTPARFSMGQMLILWLVIAPVTWFAAAQSFRRLGPDAQLNERDESGLVLLAASLTFFASCWALYNPHDLTSWDTIRLFLAACAAVAFLAAPLVIVSTNVRRFAVSVGILAHFGGMCTAAMTVPPNPWIFGQIWVRIYRPYLEFMYLNNAYHFYSPDPGPASYLWFRIYYQDPNDPTGTLHPEWHKIPRMDEKGWPQHTVALEYQRILAITENASKPAPAPALTVGPGENGQIQASPPFYAFRLERSVQAAPRPLIIGQTPDRSLRVPFHPALTHTQQYLAPTQDAKRLLEAYARTA